MEIIKGVIVFFIALCISATTCAQEQHTLHWGVDDGLSSSTVYCSFQDRKGFMWFGTDQGLCRFDGTNFKTYTVSDGLTDNDVLFLNEDTKGRLWMICFNAIPCYMENGIIHKYNPEPQTPLPQRSDYPVSITIKPNGNILIALRHGVYEIDDSLRLIKTYLTKDWIYTMIYNNEQMILGFDDSIVNITGDHEICLFHKNEKKEYIIFKFDLYKEKLYFITKDIKRNAKVLRMDIKSPGKTELFAHIRFPLYTFKILSDSTMRVIDEDSGIRMLDVRKGEHPTIFSGEKKPIGVYVDRDSNTWINTMGDGIYMMPRSGVTTYTARSGLSDNSATTICGDGHGRIVIGYRKPNIDIIGQGKTKTVTPKTLETFTYSTLCIKERGGDFYLGNTSCIYKLDKYLNLEIIWPTKEIPYSSVKKLDFTKDGGIIYANSGNAFFLDPRKHKPFVVIFPRRTTAVAVIGEELYAVGTLSGLYINDHGHIYKYDKDTALLSSRIFDISLDSKKKIWVSTYENGVFCINGDKVKRYNIYSGLLSNLCKNIFIDRQDGVWISSTKGLNKIEQTSDTTFKLKKFDTSDGLPTNEINGIYVDKGTVWLATAQGVAKFREDEISAPSAILAPPVYILSFAARDSLYVLDRPIHLSYMQNDIRIDYAGITFNSGRNIQYKYLLSGTSTHDTIYTTAATLRFGALAAGHYTLYVWAANKRKMWSIQPASISFTIAPPFWQRTWFYILAILSLAIGLWLLFRYRIRSIERKENEKASITKRISELELQALRAQMNPHFVFNALNSIQSFYANNDELAANKYMTTFSSLIRQILHSSTKNMISLKDEVTLLTSYTALEKMRFKGKFDCQIILDANIFSEKIFLPIMLIQPYVENAINHGLRFIEKDDGLLKISFIQEGACLVCTIDDNGIGIKASQERKTAQGSSHFSQGMAITRQRIDTLNTIYTDSIEITFIDKSEKNIDTTGVTVIIRIPVTDPNSTTI